MAKLFSGNNNIDPSQTNIPTAEQNQAEYLSMQEQSQKMLDFQTAEYLANKQKEQYGNIDSALNDNPQATAFNEQYAGMDNAALNQDMTQQPKAEDLDDINRNWASQFQESFIKGLGETVIGSTGDVINLMTAPLQGFSILEGNILGRALREYGDEMGNEHTTFLAKKLEGQELTWGSLIDPDFWSTTGAEMLPMMLEFIATGYGAGSAAKKGMGMFVRGASKGGIRRSVGGLLGDAAEGVNDTAKILGKGIKTAEKIENTGSGLAKYLVMDVDGKLKMSKLSNEFVGAAGAGIANNLLTGATNAMDYQRQMKALNEEDIANGLKPRYTDEEISKTVVESIKQNFHYVAMDMISWGITYGKAGEQLMGGMAKKVGLKSTERVAKEASETFTKANFPIAKAFMKAGVSGAIEGTEEMFQETYEEWASKKAEEKVTGKEVVPDYWTFYNSKQNKNTKVASFAMGALFGGAFNLKFNESANKGLDYMNRHEMLTASIDATDTGGQTARTWHIRNTMVDMVYGKKEEHFDAFMSDQVARGNVSAEEAKSYEEEFKTINEDYTKASVLNVAGLHALFSNVVQARSLNEVIENKKLAYNEQLEVIKEQFGEVDESLINEQEKEQLEILKQKVQEQTAAMTGQEEGNAKIPASKIHLDELTKKIEARNTSVVQKKYAKLKLQHETELDALSLALAQAEVNKQNLISGEKANPLNIKFWTTQNGTEMAYIVDEKGNKKAVIEGNSRELISDPNDAKMSEGQLEMNQEKGDIVAGMSNKQYERFVEMTEDQILEEAKLNHSLMLKEGGEQLKSMFGKIKDKVVGAAEKVKQKFNPDGTPVAEEDTAVENKAANVAKDTPAGNPNEDKELDEYQKEYKEAGLMTAEQAEKERLAKAEEEFLAKELEENEVDENGDPISKEQVDEVDDAPNYQIAKDSKTGKYGYVDIKTGTPHPSGKRYPTRASAKKDQLGNASLVGKVVKGGWSLTKKGLKLGAKGVVAGAKLGMNGAKALRKKGEEVVEEGSEAFAEKVKQTEQWAANQANMRQDAMRRRIMEKAFASASVRHNANNPVSPVSKNELDAYLDTKIAAFTYGPRAIDEQKTINRMLKAKGINVDVVMANNLFSLFGHEAVGYALAGTIYIDEKVWHQNDLWMHEMAHINYKLTKDTAETKAIVAEARSDQKLVDKVNDLYKEKIYIKDADGNNFMLGALIEHLTIPKPGQTQVQAIAEFEKDTEENGGIEKVINILGYTIAPDEEQTVINDELFAFYMQGPMAKNFDKAFEPIKERRRITHVKGWLDYLKGNDVQFEEYAQDVVQKLNDNKPVRREDMMEHIMVNFNKSIVGLKTKDFTGAGFASKVEKRNKKQQANHERITDTKIQQRKDYDAEAARSKVKLTRFEKIAKKIVQDVNISMKEYSEIERKNEIDYQLEELENSILEDGAFDDYESAKALTFRGATRILNSFTRSLNYIKRKRFVEEDGLASDFDEKKLIDRDVLISEIFNLAFETKGNTNKFIEAIENSRIEEVWQFNQYMEKMHPTEKYMYLSSMAFVMGNQQTISAIKSVVNSEGKWQTQNALSETERNKVDNHLKTLVEQENDHYNKRTNLFGAQNHQYFLDAYQNIKNGTQTNMDYISVLKYLAPRGLKLSELINNQTINMRGHNVNVKTLVDKLVKSKVMEQNKGETGINVNAARPFVEALVDSNRKFTSYSVIQNAEGNMEPSKITNNHLLSEINGMNEFLVKDRSGNFPSFKSFKEKYSHLSDAANRTHENPVLRSIYENAKNGILRPSVAQYVGLTHLQRGANSLYKNSNDFTQTIEDFMLFTTMENGANYVQTLSAFADSPRKFMMSVNRIKFDEVFKPSPIGNSKTELTSKGMRMLESSWRIYQKSNETLKKPEAIAKTIQSFDEYVSKFKESVNNEVSLWNTNAKSLIENKTVKADYFLNGKLSQKGKNKIMEFVFNQSVNGMALAEIFNPGIPFNEVVKRNKGNTSPIMTFGNENLKAEAIFINDESIETKTNSGMYMTDTMAQKIIDAGLGVFDLNNGLKLLNYHVERDNPNFKGKAGYFKGYTTIISEKTLVTEPGLRGVYRLLKEREESYRAYHFKKFGVEPSLDLTNGDYNYINYAVPYSAVKSDFLTDEQKKALSGLTYENLMENADNYGADKFENTAFDEINDVLDSMYYGSDKKGERDFVGLSTNNFGPQQIMDKLTEESTTPVQFISSLVVNGMVGDNLAMGEEIQSLIRTDMKQNLDEVISELGNMEPSKYKAFILKNLDLENMDQSQRLMIEESLTNLNHPAIADFITNTLANRLKQAGNKLKTNGSIAQQKPNAFYAHRDGIIAEGSTGLTGHINRVNADGSIGSAIMGMVLPKHMKNKVVFREYLTIDSPQVQRLIAMRKDLQNATSKAAATGDYSAILQEVAIMIAGARHKKSQKENSYGYNIEDYIGKYTKDGVEGWFVRGETVMGTRIPSHGPASTGVFEAVDYLEGEGNQTIVHEDFTDTAGADYDGDAIFIQRKSNGRDKVATPNFNKSLDKTVDLWTSPGMRMQIRAKIEFEKTARKVIGNNTAPNKLMPMSPAYHRHAYNNTMISKRSIGIVFNTHRIANYLAAYNVELTNPITIDQTTVNSFSDKEVGQDSRNNQSAMLANIILDNVKWGFADALGLNDQTINQYVLLINMGFSLQQVNNIMNSKAVKVWNKHQANNSNPYLTKLKNAEIKEAIAKELGIENKKIASINVSTDKMLVNTKPQMEQIINLMENLELMNADVLHLSKIMAGHNGIENNPFILEQQLKDFNIVLDSDKESPLLKFSDKFKNNPDIKAYHDTAATVLGILKKASHIYSTNTSQLIESLNAQIGFDETMNKEQMKRASDIIKRFQTSRILGLNNLSSSQKNKAREKVFRDVQNYMNSLSKEKLPGNRGATALDKSVLFNRALNMDIQFAPGQSKKMQGAKVYSSKSYISANPRFFNESLTEEDRRAAQEEWKALPQEIKDGLIVLDMMKNGLAGKLSLSAVFDEKTNRDISTYATHESVTKNTPISEEVMRKLENLIISNEFNQNFSILNATNPKEQYNPKMSYLEYIAKNNNSLDKALKRGKGMIFKIDGKPYVSKGFTDAERDAINRNYKAYDEKTNAMNLLIASRIKPFKKFEGDVNLEAISIADEVGRPLYKSAPSNITKENSFMESASNAYDSAPKKKVKSDLGNASKIDYHNYNDIAPLNQREFNVAMEYGNNINDEQKAFVYKKYLEDKKEANNLTNKFNQTSYSKMTDQELSEAYKNFAQKDLYAYSIITTPLVMELANRMGVEQSALTKVFENGEDISLMDSWLNNNNITGHHPVTQKLVRMLNVEYKNFVLQRGKYIKAINEVTDTLYQEKFGLSKNKIVNTIQRIGQSLFKDRKEVYKRLYGNLLSEETYKDANGVEQKNLKLKTEEEIQELYKAKKLSKAEYDFYTVFKKTTGHLKAFDGNDKVQKGYIPHTSMDNFEMFSNRGLLGLMVNSKGIDSVINDVKIYTDITGKRELMSFGDIRNQYNALAVSKKQTVKDLAVFEKLKRTAIKLQKTGKNEDGSRVIYSDMQNETLLGMSPMTRFEHSRSSKAELMPSMDLNKALIDYVHSSIFANGDGEFKGFKAMMPMIDGVMAYNDKNGYKNAYNYVKEVIKEGFIMNKDQVTFGKNTDAVINGLVKSNTFYALGYKGLLIGKGIYAIGNIAAGKYMNLKREGGKKWAIGEARYWGVDKGISLDVFDRRRRASNILKNLGYMEADFYDDVNIQSKTGLDSVFTKIALSPMTVSENWIQKSYMLGMLTDEEFNLFDENGEYKTGAVQITDERFHVLEERVRNAQGKGFSPTDQSRIHRYAIGKMFMQFSRHLPVQIRERFAKEDIDMNGQKYIGSLRQVGRTAIEIFNNRMTPEKFKEYYATLQDHEKEALLSGLRGAALMTVLGFVAGNSEGESQMLASKTDASTIASGVMSDANIHFDPNRMLLKIPPPTVRSTMAVLKMLTGGGEAEK